MIERTIMPVNGNDFIPLCQNQCNNTAEYVIFVKGDDPSTNIKRVCRACSMAISLTHKVLEVWTLAEYEADHADAE